MRDDEILQLIRESPGDDAPRLVYADWLQEHGDADRAELIRVQCRLTSLTAADPARPAVEARERDLLAANRRRWLAPFELPEGVPAWEFRRGFVESVNLPYDTFLAHAAALRGLAPVAVVRLHAGDPLRRDTVPPPPGPRMAQALAASEGLAWLSALDLSNNKLTDNDAKVLAGSPHLAGLLWLDLSWNRIGWEGAGELAGRGELTRLWTLSLAHNRVRGAGAIRLAQSPRLASLTRLDLSANEIDPPGAEGLARSPHLAGLRVLDLSDNRLGGPGVAALAASPHLKRLRQLYLARNGIDPGAAKALAGAANLRRLEVLDLTGNPLDQQAIKLLRDKFGPALELG